MIAVMVIILALWGLHLLPFAFPDARWWGVNHLLFLPHAFTVAYVILGIVTAAGTLIPRARHRILSGYDWTARALFKNRFPMRWGICALIAAIAFWVFRIPVNLLGDSYTVTANIGNALPVYYKWTEIGAVFVAQTISRLLPLSGMELGKIAYQILSVISGGISIYFVLALSFEIHADIRMRSFTLGMFIFAGWTLLFFGYTENYSILWPFATAYLYTSLLELRRERPPVIPGLIVVAAMLMHIQIVWMLPSLAYLIYEYMASRHERRPGKTISSILIASAVAIIVALFIIVYKNSLEAQLLLIRMGSGHYGTPDYTLFSPAHLLDIGNLLILLIPVLPILVVMTILGKRAEPFEAFDRFLLILSLGGMVFLFAVEPKLGMGRDWDLFALCGLGPLIWLIRRIKIPDSRCVILLPIVLMLSAVMVAPFLIANLRTDSAVNNYSYLLKLDQGRSRAGYTILRDYYFAQGDSVAGDSIKTLLADTYPAVRLVRYALRLRDAGQYTQALAVADSLYALDPYAIETLSLRGMTLLMMGRHEEALRDLKLAAQLGRYDSRILVNLAQAYFMSGEIEKAMPPLRRAQNSDPHSFFVNEALATIYLQQRRFDSAYVYATHMIEADSLFADGYSMAGISALNLQDTIAARDLLSRYLLHAPEGVDKEFIKDVLRQIE